MVRVCFTLLALLVALPAWAQQLKLDIRDGLVTLSADNVPVRQVLAEWAKVGGTRVVGAERIAGPPLTLSLEGVPEAKALDIILRGAAGYVAAARPVPGVGGVDVRPHPGAGHEHAAGWRCRGRRGRAGNRPGPGNRFGVPPVAEAEPVVEAVPEPQDMPETAPQANPFATAFGQPAGGPFAPAQADAVRAAARAAARPEPVPAGRRLLPAGAAAAARAPRPSCLDFLAPAVRPFPA